MPPLPPPPSPVRRAAAAATALVLTALLLGALVNAVRPHSLPWAGDWSRHVETLARNARLPVVYLPELLALASSPTPPLFLDARPPAEFALSRLPRARSLPAPGDEPSFLALAEALSHDLSSPVVAYCSSIDCTDALELALALRDRGFSNVRLYPGGFAEWSRWGGPIETGDDAP